MLQTLRKSWNQDTMVQQVPGMCYGFQVSQGVLKRVSMFDKTWRMVHTKFLLRRNRIHVPYQNLSEFSQSVVQLFNFI